MAMANTVNFTWDDPNPAGTVDHYDLYIDDVLNQSVNVTSASVDLPAGTNYTAYVEAVGTSGLRSLPSDPLSFYTLQIIMNLRLN